MNRQRKILLLIVLTFGFASLLTAARWKEPQEVYHQRREMLRGKVSAGVILVFAPGAAEAGHELEPFHQDDDFYYLTGLDQPGAALLLVPKGAEKPGLPAQAGRPNEILFLRSPNPAEEKWTGPRWHASDPNIREKTGFDVVRDWAEFYRELAAALGDSRYVYTVYPLPDAAYAFERARMTELRNFGSAFTFADIAPMIHAMRQVKGPTELELLQKAIDLSLDAHLEAMKTVRPGLYEYEVAALMEYVMKRGGCERMAYAPIVGSGINSTVLHYSQNSRRMEDGDLLLMDVAGEYGGYAADITRTIPVNGKFTPRQREIYEIVLGAQNAALAAARPGATIGRTGENSLYKIAYDYINTHGKDKHGNPLGRYFIHGLSHHIGLYVHDVGDVNRPLEPGMVFTIEPGIYIPEENIGVRIEDDVLVTADGAKLLSARLPRDPAEIERIMAEARLRQAATPGCPAGSSCETQLPFPKK